VLEGEEERKREHEMDAECKKSEWRFAILFLPKANHPLFIDTAHSVCRLNCTQFEKISLSPFSSIGVHYTVITVFIVVVVIGEYEWPQIRLHRLEKIPHNR
jgi:hypothetical protein